MRRSFATAGLPLVVGLAACATGTPTVELDPAAAEVDVNPAAAQVGAEPESIPLAWFADNWGPFEAIPSEFGEADRIQPLFIVDGVQISPSAERQREILDHIVEGPGFEGSPGEFEVVRIFRHRCDAQLFDVPGLGGIVMAFSHEYDGPLPGPDSGHTLEVSREHPPGETCHRESP